VELIGDKGKIHRRLGGPRRVGLDGFGKSLPQPEFDPWTVASSYTDCAILVHGVNELGCLISAALYKHSQSVKPAKLVFPVRQQKVS
jgi:hypothetical protein